VKEIDQVLDQALKVETKEVNGKKVKITSLKSFYNHSMYDAFVSASGKTSAK
jgi:hypothetical protein